MRAQAERLEPLQKKEGRKGVHRGPHVAQDVEADLDGEHRPAERVGKAHAVIALCGLGEVREFARRGPVELAPIDDDAPEDSSMSTDPLCGAVRDDVGAVLDGADEVIWQ